MDLALIMTDGPTGPDPASLTVAAPGLGIGHHPRPMPPPWPTTPPTPAHRASYADARAEPYWLDRLPARAPQERLRVEKRTELCIVGGGFTGLWAALHAKRDDPERDVVLLEARTIGFGASGRNGGFVVSSLTHGLANGLSRFADEMELLERLGRANLRGLVADIERLGIACDLELTGELLPALAPYQEAWLETERDLAQRYGYAVQTFGDAVAMQGEVASPTYHGGIWVKDAGGILDPAQFAVGLMQAALRAGVHIHESTPALGLEDRPDGVVVRAAHGSVHARKVLLATSAFPPLLRSLRRSLVAVYDYVLVTEPLTSTQRAAIGRPRRQGIGDGANQFHYYRLTRDERILWGGYDAVYRFGGPVRDDLDEHDPTFARLAQNFFTTFPQLEGVRFSHRWGGAIDTCSRFSVFFGRLIAAAWPTRSATPAWASGPRGSEPRWRWTCSTGAAPRRRRAATCGASRCRSRPSPCAAP